MRVLILVHHQNLGNSTEAWDIRTQTPQQLPHLPHSHLPSVCALLLTKPTPGTVWVFAQSLFSPLGLPIRTQAVPFLWQDQHFWPRKTRSSSSQTHSHPHSIKWSLFLRKWENSNPIKINVHEEKPRTVLAPRSLKWDQNTENWVLKSSFQLFFYYNSLYKSSNNDLH